MSGGEWDRLLMEHVMKFSQKFDKLSLRKNAATRYPSNGFAGRKIGLDSCARWEASGRISRGFAFEQAQN